MKKLKKVIIKVPTNLWYAEFFDIVEKYEVLQILSYGKENIYMIFKIKFYDKKANPKILEELNLDFYDTEVITEDKSKNEYICFSKHRWPENLLNTIFKNIDVLIEPPIILEDNYLIVKSLIEYKDLDDVLKLAEKMTGNMIEILSITSINPNYDNLYLTLTDRQKEIIFYAVRQGYYDIPRKISSKELANKFNISESALYEHLRKIEKAIFNSIFR
jgi:predicted DNA binding protein